LRPILQVAVIVTILCPDFFLNNVKRFALAAALASTFASAQSGATDFYGAYVGAKIGTNRSDTTGTISSARNGAATYGLEGGYGWDVGAASLGVNAFYDANQETTHAPLTAQYGNRMYGLGLKVGLPIESVMPYAKLGYGRTNGTGALSSLNADSAKSGVGLEYKIAPNWSVAGEWATASPTMRGLRLDEDNFTFGLNYYFAPPVSRSTPAVKNTAP
jgi:OOP family OmpA-OmpF porin